MVYCTSLVSCLVAGCGVKMHPIEPIFTEAIEFDCDPVINGGKPLPIDIIYITYVQELREVTRLGPIEWFKTEKRKQWKFKESVMLKGNDQAVVRLDPLVMERTVLLVIYANYTNAIDPANQQVVVDYASGREEIIKVKKTRLQANNESLRYVK